MDSSCCSAGKQLASDTLRTQQTTAQCIVSHTLIPYTHSIPTSHAHIPYSYNSSYNSGKVARTRLTHPYDRKHSSLCIASDTHPTTILKLKG
ncbi:hypothetical protein EON63_14030 [archaeon]|nr:MAG: hypothetical protein EON63_14030 [archaeon]